MSNRNYVISRPDYYEALEASFVSGDHVTPYPYNIVKRYWIKDSYFLANGAGPFYGNMGLGKLLSVPPSVKDNVQISNLLKINDRLRDSSFNASVALAEGQDTIRLLGNTIQRVSMSVGELRRGNVIRAAKHLGINLTPDHHRRVVKANLRDKAKGILKNPSKSASQSWLELQFGWLPLLSDIDTGAEALANIQFKPRTLTARASNRSGGQPSLSGFNSEERYTVGYASWITRTNYQSGLVVGVESPINNIGRLGLDTPYTALWNVVPWSFLLDYVIPIGDYLNAKEAINKIDALSYVKWEKETNHMRGVWSPSFAEKATPAVYSKVAFNRSVLEPNQLKNVPLPSIKPLKSIFSTTHVLNSIALLRGAFK